MHNFFHRILALAVLATLAAPAVAKNQVAVACAAAVRDEALLGFLLSANAPQTLLDESSKEHQLVQFLMHFLGIRMLESASAGMPPILSSPDSVTVWPNSDTPLYIVWSENTSVPAWDNKVGEYRLVLPKNNPVTYDSPFFTRLLDQGMVAHPLHRFTVTPQIAAERTLVGESTHWPKPGQDTIALAFAERLVIHDFAKDTLRFAVTGATGFGKTAILNDNLHQSAHHLLKTGSPRIILALMEETDHLEQLVRECKAHPRILDQPNAKLEWIPFFESETAEKYDGELEKLLANEFPKDEVRVIALTWRSFVAAVQEISQDHTRWQSFYSKVGAVFVDEAEEMGAATRAEALTRFLAPQALRILYGQEAVLVRNDVLAKFFLSPQEVPLFARAQQKGEPYRFKNLLSVVEGLNDHARPDTTPAAIASQQIAIATQHGLVTPLLRFQQISAEELTQQATPNASTAQSISHSSPEFLLPIEELDPSSLYGDLIRDKKGVYDERLETLVFNRLAQHFHDFFLKHQGFVKVGSILMADRLGAFLKKYFARLGLRVETYHSKIDPNNLGRNDTLSREEIMQRYMDPAHAEHIDWLVTVKTMERAVNIPHLSGAILIGRETDASVILNIIGRLMRLYPGKRYAEFWQISDSPTLDPKIFSDLALRAEDIRTRLEAIGNRDVRVAMALRDAATIPFIKMTAAENRALRTMTQERLPILDAATPLMTQDTPPPITDIDPPESEVKAFTRYWLLALAQELEPTHWEVLQKLFGENSEGRLPQEVRALYAKWCLARHLNRINQIAERLSDLDQYSRSSLVGLVQLYAMQIATIVPQADSVARLPEVRAAAHAVLKDILQILPDFGSITVSYDLATYAQTLDPLSYTHVEYPESLYASLERLRRKYRDDSGPIFAKLPVSTDEWSQRLQRVHELGVWKFAHLNPDLRTQLRSLISELSVSVGSQLNFGFSHFLRGEVKSQPEFLAVIARANVYLEEVRKWVHAWHLLLPDDPLLRRAKELMTSPDVWTLKGRQRQYNKQKSPKENAAAAQSVLAPLETIAGVLLEGSSLGHPRLDHERWTKSLEFHVLQLAYDSTFVDRATKFQTAAAPLIRAMESPGAAIDKEISVEIRNVTFNYPGLFELLQTIEVPAMDPNSVTDADLLKDVKDVWGSEPNYNPSWEWATKRARIPFSTQYSLGPSCSQTYLMFTELKRQQKLLQQARMEGLTNAIVRQSCRILSPQLEETLDLLLGTAELQPLAPRVDSIGFMMNPKALEAAAQLSPDKFSHADYEEFRNHLFGRLLGAIPEIAQLEPWISRAGFYKPPHSLPGDPSEGKIEAELRYAYPFTLRTQLILNEIQHQDVPSVFQIFQRTILWEIGFWHQALSSISRLKAEDQPKDYRHRTLQASILMSFALKLNALAQVTTGSRGDLPVYPQGVDGVEYMYFNRGAYTNELERIPLVSAEDLEKLKNYDPNAIDIIHYGLRSAGLQRRIQTRDSLVLVPQINEGNWNAADLSAFLTSHPSRPYMDLGELADSMDLEKVLLPERVTRLLDD